MFLYFREERGLSDILKISHGLVLTHLPNGELLPCRDQPLFFKIAEIYRIVEARRGGTSMWTMAEDIVASRPFLYPTEQVGMFLRIRITSRFCLSYCSRWYQETVRGEIATIIRLRQRENRIQHHRESAGFAGLSGWSKAGLARKRCSGGADVRGGPVKTKVSSVVGVVSDSRIHDH